MTLKLVDITWTLDMLLNSAAARYYATANIHQCVINKDMSSCVFLKFESSKTLY